MSPQQALALALAPAYMCRVAALPPPPDPLRSCPCLVPAVETNRDSQELASALPALAERASVLRRDAEAMALQLAAEEKAEEDTSERGCLGTSIGVLRRNAEALTGPTQAAREDWAARLADCGASLNLHGVSPFSAYRSARRASVTACRPCFIVHLVAKRPRSLCVAAARACHGVVWGL